MNRRTKGSTPGAGLAASLRAWVERAAKIRPSESARQALLLVAVLVFVGAAAWGIFRLPPLKLRLSWLGAAAVVALLTPVTNAFEYWLAGRWVGRAISAREAISVTVQASAANLAPIPGAALVRGRALYSRGASPARTALALGAIGVGWLALALAAAAAAFMLRGNPVLAAAFGAGGLVFGGLVVVLLPDADRSAKATLSCLGLEAAAVVVAAGRLFFVLNGIGIEAGFRQVLILPVAGAVASAAGLFPGGLGLREVLAGGLAPLVGLPIEAGVVGAAVDRVLGLVLLGIVSGILVTAWWGSTDGEDSASV